MTLTSEETNLFQTIPIQKADAAALEKISQEGLLSLTLTEMRAIQDYFKKINRDPTDCELESIAQTWSEHCVHKTFKGQFNYKEEDLNGQASLSDNGLKTYDNLLKDTIAKATTDLNMPWCLSVFVDNAGVIEFDNETGISFKVETHNHPSALEPYGGAGTGIGGVIRDVMGCGLGGKPVFNTDVFCFGPPDTPLSDLPKGAHHPRRIARGVIDGVRDYGNRMGIPTANGAVYFDPGYVGNPLVFCGTVGLQPKNTISKEVKPGDFIVAVGGRTGRDGIHGATFSSAPLESGITSNVVQIGHSIMEKKVLDVLLQARDKGLYRSITDCGAGGFSSSVGELGAETGVEVYLDEAPLKYKGLTPWEIWVSESQERMVLAVDPEKWPSLKILFALEDVEAVKIGVFTETKHLVLKYGTQTVADIEMDFLHNGVPKLKLNATWNPGDYFNKHVEISESDSHQDENIPATIKGLLSHPNVASKESVVRQYDHEVQGATIIKPFMGVHYDGPTDAAVFRPNLKSWRGVGVSNGMNPEVGKRDPYIMAKMAVDEAYRNLISVGGGLKYAAILDNFCWGDAKDSLELGALVRAAEGCREAAMAYKLPFISGKDSFNNTWKSPGGALKSIPATLLISAIGVLDDVRNCLTSSLKQKNNLLYLVGEDSGAMGGSLAQVLWKKSAGNIPNIDLDASAQLYKKLKSAMKFKSILSCHDISDGGLVVAAIEMAFGGDLGIQLKIPKESKNSASFLFNESPSRFVVEVSPELKDEFEQVMGLKSTVCIGFVTENKSISIDFHDQTIFKEDLKILKDLWKGPLKHL